MAMALGLHELATNSAKYGALSTPAGRVSLTWTIDGEGPERRFRQAWREAGGPTVRSPIATGFGTRLIEKGLARGVRGEAHLDYAASGFVFTLVAPLSSVLREV